MCKGDVLEKHIKEHSRKIDSVVYVGDGSNDFCPTLRLKDRDYVAIREGYKLHHAVKEY